MFPTPPKLRPQPCPSLAGSLGQGLLVCLSGGEDLWYHGDGHHALIRVEKGKSLLEGLIHAKEEQENRKKEKLEGSDV